MHLIPSVIQETKYIFKQNCVTLTTKNFDAKNLGVLTLGVIIWAEYLEFTTYKFWAEDKFGPFLFDPLLLKIFHNDV